MPIINKVKNRHRVLLISNNEEVKKNFPLLLSSHGYLVDIAEDFPEAQEKMMQYKPSIFIGDITLLPDNPDMVVALFKQAKKFPVFLLIENEKRTQKQKEYIDSGVDDVLAYPYDADKLYYKINRAANYNRMQHEIAYHSGMIFILKFMLPIFLLIMYLLKIKG